jgi:hypothetical protein
MSSITFRQRISKTPPEEALDETAWICAAADLLLLMFVELEALGLRHPAFARTLWSRAPDAHARLRTLHEIVDSLLIANDEVVAAQLKRRAAVLITRLSDELDELTLCAIDEDFPDNLHPTALH